MRYRKKPVIIEAVQIKASDYCPNAKDPTNIFDGFPFDDSPQWLLDAVRDGMIVPVTPNNTDYAEWWVKTLEDGKDGKVKHIATPGDYIIRGVMGEIYPCKPDIFEMTYERVEE